MRHFAGLLRGREAVSALEYAILVGVIAVAIATALATFGGNITTALSAIGTQISSPDADALSIGSGGGNEGGGADDDDDSGGASE